jgi:hypothetical protein
VRHNVAELNVLNDTRQLISCRERHAPVVAKIQWQ